MPYEKNPKKQRQTTPTEPASVHEKPVPATSEFEQLVRLMMDEPQRRSRGRPRATFSVDYQRAKMLEPIMAFLHQAGRTETQKEVIARIQAMARKGDLPEQWVQLFPDRDLQASVSRGKRELKQRRDETRKAAKISK